MVSKRGPGEEGYLAQILAKISAKISAKIWAKILAKILANITRYPLILGTLLDTAESNHKQWNRVLVPMNSDAFVLQHPYGCGISGATPPERPERGGEPAGAEAQDGELVGHGSGFLGTLGPPCGHWRLAPCSSTL